MQCVQDGRLRFRDDRGQTAAEHLGAIVVVAVLVAVLATTGLGASLRAGVVSALCAVVQTCTPDSASLVPEPAAGDVDVDGTSAGAAGGSSADGGLSPDDLLAYLTGAVPPPASFVAQHYAPVLVDTPSGTRYADPFGACSSPFGDSGRSFDFGVACDVHDYGYDLLRFFGLGGAWREAVDALFAADVDAACDDRGWTQRPTCELWAELYGAAVALGTRLDGGGTPGGAIGAG